MDTRHLDQLIKGVRQMRRHIAGKPVRDAKTTELPMPDDVRTILEAEAEWPQEAMSAPSRNCANLAGPKMRDFLSFFDSLSSSE